MNAAFEPQSELVTLDALARKGTRFHVPIYQRLYVWGTEQINTLLEDLWEAHRANSSIYYLGGTLVVEQHGPDGSSSLELIDGQQRLTTLWMMSLALRGELSRFAVCGHVEKELPRLTFAIRPEVNTFFDQLLRHGFNRGLPEHPQIVDALATIKAFAERVRGEENRGTDPQPGGFSGFMMRSVHLVLTKVPPSTDLNRLFEAINSRGTQLQHHEILKAKILACIPGSQRRDRDLFATLWDACAHMDNYVEKNLREMTAIQIAGLYSGEDARRENEALCRSERILGAMAELQNDSEEAAEKSLEEVLEVVEPNLETGSSSEQEDDHADHVRSIVSFSVLLQHTLRIWLSQRDLPDLPRIADGKLLELFSAHFFDPEREPHRAMDAALFICLLWEVRYCFDKHVIKWVEADGQEQHLICPLGLNRTEEQPGLQRHRPESNDEFTLLQSTLYHSQQITTHYWLTPLLDHLLRCRGSVEDHCAFLRHLENHLLCSVPDGRTLAERSWLFLKEPQTELTLVKPSEVLTKPPLGTACPHYWFYKLEFVLWIRAYPGTDAYHKTFRVTAKNSVEHISPQSAQDYDSNVVPVECLDFFGNLALVSRSLNSEFSNKTFKEKRAKFRESNKTRTDSLKMALIYSNPTWGEREMSHHQQQMLDLLDSYLASDG